MHEGIQGMKCAEAQSQTFFTQQSSTVVASTGSNIEIEIEIEIAHVLVVTSYSTTNFAHT